MTVLPFQISEVAHLYNKYAKLKPSAVPDKEPGEPQDVVSISSEARKRQVHDQAQTGAGSGARISR